MRIFASELVIPTRGHTDVVDLTETVRKIVAKEKIQEGTAILFVSGSTAGITTMEYEPGLIEDIQAAFGRIAPEELDYAHHQRWGDDNGHSHIRASLLGPSLTVPIHKGKLTLGTWQQIVLIDFDTSARKRTVVVQMIGE